MRLRTIAQCAIASTLLLAGCDDHTPLCVPNTVERCVCATGDPGQRTCAADGESFGDCACLPDAGIDAPASTSAPLAPLSP